MIKNLAYNYNFPPLDGYDFRSVIREFIDNGAKRFVINDALMLQMVNDPERVNFLHQLCKDMEVEFSSVHGLYGKNYDLNIPVCTQGRKQMLEVHQKAMQIAADFGCKTYTMHVGAHHYCNEKVPLDTLRPLALETLEKLLPSAEKLGLVIAVENSFEKPNSAREVLGLVTHFSTPSIGVCYDTGHANCMASAPGKDMSKYECYFNTCWWEEGVIWENNAIETLHDHIVTCHIHDNNGYGDYHSLPFDGTINWRELMPKLFSCPRMIDYQTEIEYADGENWAGTLLSPIGGYSIRRVVDTFRRLGF